MSFDRVVPILVLLPLLLFANPKVIGGERLNQLQESDYDVFSVDFPGKWAGKAGTHAPMIKIVGSNLEISVNHAAKNIDHMVTHLILLNENRKIVALEILQDGMAPKYTIRLSMVAGSKFVTPYAYCNLHGMWKGEALELPSTSREEL
mmetsp:Transcript_7488/g.9107  ORF Transcript_7488/g.9107 Transcript_7488/m.9107 type:complete len:148 (-) Transcript_7488:202-645(-)